MGRTCDKESTWFDEDSGENQYDLVEGASYKLPHISNKSLEICSLMADGDLIKAEIYVITKLIPSAIMVRVSLPTRTTIIWSRETLFPKLSVWSLRSSKRQRS